MEADAPGRGGPLPGGETRREGRAGRGTGSPETAAIAPEDARLTDEQWALVHHLLPPRRGAG